MSLPAGPPAPPLPDTVPVRPPLKPSATSPAAVSPPPVRLSNHYIRRLTSTPRSCFVCSRPSPIVLVSRTATADDFFYVCASHLTDRHFAALIEGSYTTTAAAGGLTGSVRLPDKVSQLEIDRVKKEWEDRQLAKKNKKDVKDVKDEKDSKDKKDDTQGWLSYLASSINSATSPTPDKTSTPPRSIDTAATATGAVAVPSAAPKAHEEYILHRTFYAMRVDAHNKKVALRRAKELNFPSVPRQ